MKSNILDMLSDADKAKMHDDMVGNGSATMQITVDIKSRVTAVRVPPGKAYDTSLLGRVVSLFKKDDDSGKGEA